MPDPELAPLYNRLRQRRAADPEGYARRMAKARALAGDDAELTATLDEIDRLPAWNEAGFGGNVGAMAQRGGLGAGQMLASPLALAEAAGRKAWASTVRAFGGESHAADIETIRAQRDFSPLAQYLELGERQRQLSENLGSYDQPTGAKGFATQVVGGTLESLPPVLLAGATGGAERAGVQTAGQLARAMNQQALLAGAQGAAQQTGQATDFGTQPASTRGLVNALVQGGIEGLLTRIGARGGVEALFDAEQAGKPFLRRLGADLVEEGVEEGTSNALQTVADRAIMQGELATPGEIGESYAVGATSGALMAGPLTSAHHIAQAFAGRAPAAKVTIDPSTMAVALMDPNGRMPAPAVAGAPTTSTPQLEEPAPVAAPTPPIAAAAPPAVDLTPSTAAVAPPAPAVAPPAPAVAPPAPAPIAAQAHALYAAGKQVIVETAEGPAALIHADENGLIVRTADGEELALPDEAVTAVHDADELRAAMAAQQAPAPAPAAPVENAPKPTAKGLEGFVLRTPGGRGKAMGQVLERVGNAHFIAVDAAGQHFVASTDRHAVTRARRRGAAVPLQPVDPALGRGLRRNEKHSGRLPTRYATVEEARAAAQKADVAYGEPEDVLGEERKAKAGEGPTGGLQAERPIEVVVGEKPASTATKAERTQAKREARAEGQPPATEVAETEAREANVAKAAERINRAIMQVEEAPPRLADVNRAVEEARKEFEEGLEPGSILREIGKVLFSEKHLAQIGLTPTASREQLAKGLAELHRKLGEANSGVAALIRKGEARAAAPLLAPINGTPRQQDGLSAQDRLETLGEFARSLGVGLAIGESQLRIGRRNVDGYFDPLTNTVILTPGQSLTQGIARIVHEVMHAEIGRLTSTEKRAFFDVVANALGDPVEATEAVRKRWGRLLPKDDTDLDPALEEIVSDAGAQAVLSNHNNILGQLPVSLGEKLVKFLHRIGNAVTRLLRRLPGLKGLKKSEKGRLRDIAERLLRVRLERQRGFVKDAQTVPERLADLIRATKPEAQALPDVANSGGDLHERVLNWAGKLAISDKSTAGTKAQKASIGLWADAFHVARRFPMADQVLQGLEAASRIAHRRAYDLSQDIGPAIKHLQSRGPRAVRLLYDLRLAEIDRMAQGGDRFTMDEGSKWLASRGATAQDIQAAQTLWGAGLALRDAHMEALAKLLGLKRALSAKQTRELIHEFESLPPDQQPKEVGDMLRAWLPTVEAFEASTSDVYVPFIRLKADDDIRVTQDGETLHRESSNRKNTAQRVQELRRKYPGAEVETRPSAPQLDSSPAADAVLERIRAAATKAHADGEAVDALLEVVRPGLLTHILDTSRLSAKGIAGFDQDLGRVMSTYVSAANHSIERLDSISRTRAAMNVLASDGKRPRLYEFARKLLYADPASDFNNALAKSRMLVSARALSAPAVAIQNTIGAVTINPFVLADLTGKPAAAVTGAWGELLKSVVNPVAAAKDLANIASSRLEPHSAMIEWAAKHLAPDEAEALRRAVRETDVLLDPEAGRLLDYLHPGAAGVAVKVSRALMALQAVTDRGARIASFIAAYRVAARFTNKEWAFVREKRGYNRAQDPYEFAVWATQNINGAYGARYRPQLFRGPVGAMAFQMSSWAKLMTHASMDIGRHLLRERSGAALGTAAGLAVIGTLAHGLKDGIPLFGTIAAELIDVAMGLGTDDDWDDWLIKQTAAADRDGDYAEAFLWRTLRGGLGEAAAGTETLHRPGAVVSAVAKATAPRGLLVSTAMGHVVGGREIAVKRLATDLYDAAADIKAGITADNGEAVARGVARVFGPWATDVHRAVEKAVGKGVVAERTTLPGKTSKTVAADGHWEDIALLAAGVEPREAQRLREMTAEMKELHDRQQATVDARVYGLVDAIRGDDSEAINDARGELTSYLKEQVQRLGSTTDRGERARLYAELSWMLGPNAEKALESRIQEAFLNRKFGLDRPLGNVNELLRQESAQAAGGQPRE